MKLGLFSRLAFGNIKKNHQLYVPHILAGTGLTGIFYIMLTLAKDERLQNIKGGYAIPSIMVIGIAVVSLLSVILVFFTNSFLMKQRTREYGMYNVLGMEKKHVGRIMFLESLFSTAASIALGLGFGILAYKLCCLFICKMLHVSTILGFYVNGKCVLVTAGAFAAMYLLAFLWNRMRLAFLKPVELLASAGAGEKEPKIRWILLVIGLGTMGYGYYLAVTTENPLRAIPTFFIAVILVIIGTYALFLAGTIALLKFLKKRNGFYYRKSNMVAVSDLLYRMKQNAVGLASITILATGVMVMMSSTVSLYSGTEGTIKQYYMDGRADMFVEANYALPSEEESRAYSRYQPIPEEDVRAITENVLSEFGAKVVYMKPMRTYNETYEFKQDGTLIPYRSDSTFATPPEDCVTLVIMPIDDYNGLMGTDYKLSPGEVLFTRNSKGAGNLSGREISFGDRTYRIEKEVEGFVGNMTEAQIVDVYGILVPGVEDATALLKYTAEHAESYFNSFVSHQYYVKLNDTKAISERDTEQQSNSRFGEEIQKYLNKTVGESVSVWTGWDTSWELRNELYGMYGSLFFLGILLSIVFLFATALIIYYKQISEGYDDRNRFRILKKVGMTEKETKATIRRQIMIVFFLPVVAAVIHMAVAYGVIRQLLSLLFLPDDKLFLLCTGITIVAFTLIYWAIYKITARTYYRIVR